MAEEWGVWLALPGLGLVLVGLEVGLLVGDVLEVVEFDAEGFAATEVVEECVVGLLGFGFVLLGEVDEV